MGLLALAAILVFLVAACAPAAAPTPTPTKAAPAATPTAASTAAPKAAEPTKPAATPTPSKPTGAPVKIGVITPLSGPTASYGALMRIAVKLAEEDVNNSGGINGSPLELLIEDSPQNPKEAVTAVRRLAEQQKVFAIVGPYFSAEFEVAAPLANELKVVVVGATGVFPEIAAGNRPWAFANNVPEAINTPPAIAAFKKLHPDAKKVVMIGDVKARVTENAVKNIYPKMMPENGLEIIATVPFETGMTDFSAIITKLKDYNPQGILVAAIMPEALGLAKELQRQQVKIPVLCGMHAIGGPVVQLGGDALEGWVFASLFDWENPDPKVQAFVKRFFERAQADPNVTPKPQHLVTEGLHYDAVMFLVDIMRKAGVKADTPVQEARQKVLEGMTKLKDYPGIGGKISMLPSGNADPQPAPPFMAEKGKYKIIR